MYHSASLLITSTNLTASYNYNYHHKCRFNGDETYRMKIPFYNVPTFTKCNLHLCWYNWAMVLKNRCTQKTKPVQDVYL